MNGGKIVLVVCMLLAGLSTARAQSVTLDINNYSFGNGSIDGGEFTANTSQNFLGSYASTAVLNGGFETFCVQSTVDFYSGNTYSYVLTNTDSAGQPLTLGAAYLYQEFATGNLAGYDYLNTDPTNTRLTDAGELQLALWTLQGQTVPSGFPSLSTDPFYNLAITDLGGTSAAFADNNGTYGVDIIQLYDANGAPAQAQLVLTPEPPTILLFVFAGILMVLFNRRKMLRGLQQALR